jgi:hypothetical protein
VLSRLARLLPAQPTVALARASRRLAHPLSSLAAPCGPDDFPCKSARPSLRTLRAGASCVDLFGGTGPNYTVDQADVGSTLRIRVKGTNASGSTTATSPPTWLVLPPILTLLANFQPELRYAQNEGYRADSAAEISNSHSSSPGAYSNYLFTPSGFYILAASDPTAPLPREDHWDPLPLLTLDFLRPGSYSIGVSVDSADFLDEHDETEESDAYYMHTHGYADVAYARYAEVSSSEVYLQYWFFYYYNPKQFSVIGVGEHEGDWEMVQYRLDRTATPQTATYSQHKGGEACSWSAVPKTSSGRPVAYVGEGSHANYFWAGDHPLPWGPFTFRDYTNELGDQYVPANLEDVSNPPQWMRWPGIWGASGGSPTGPYSHSQWADPRGYENAAEPCTTPSGAWLDLKAVESRDRPERGQDRAQGPVHGQLSVIAPPFPKINVTRAGQRITVRYCFATTPKDPSRKPWQIITAVDSTRHDQIPPFVLRTRVTLPCGRVVSALGRAKPPRVVRVAIMSRTGAQTPSSTYSIPG